MSPKGAHSSGGGGAAAANADIKSEQVLVAILLADPYGDEKSWGPAVRQEADEDEDEGAAAETASSAQRPWCLTPLLGVPLLGWTLESLASGGVKQVFVFVRSGVEAVRRFTSLHAFSTSDVTPLSITVCPTSAFTPGDVLREVDSRALLKSSSSSGGSSAQSSESSSHEGTFIIARCGYIGTLDFTSTCSAFAARMRREGNLPCLCTVVRSSPPSSMPSQTVHAVTREGRLAFFSTAPKYPRIRRAMFPVGGEGQNVLVRTDLESIGIDICSVEVPQLFTENFDYQHIRPDFISGILTSDLLGKTIYVKTVAESDILGDAKGAQWAERAGDIRSFASVAAQILARKSHPLAPDENMPGDRYYAQRRNRVYIGDNVDLARDCVIGPSALVGPSSSIGPRSSITNSILGASVSVRAECSITGSFIFDDVSIAPHTCVHDSVIDDGVSILEGSIIEAGCLIGRGVRVGRGARLRGVQAGLRRPDGAKDATEGAALGEDGEGEVWAFSQEDADSDDEDEQEKDLRNLKLSRLGVSIRDEELVSSASSLSSMSTVASIESKSSISVSGASGIGQVGATGDFLGEAIRSLDRAFVEGVTVENALLELKTLRMASNVPQARLRGEVVSYLCQKGGSTPAEASRIIAQWGGLIAGLVGDDKGAMSDALLALQRYCAENAAQTRLFPAFLQAYYNADVVSEEGIVQWYRSPLSRSTGGEAGSKLRDIGGRFVQKLMEADSESDDE